MANVTRRGFVCGCSAAIAAMAGTRFTSLAFGQPGFNNDVLVVVFGRGGFDGLNMVMPITGPDRGYYEAARPFLKVPVSGTGAAVSLNGQFGLHPGAGLLAGGAWGAGDMAIVHACGLKTEVTRSHFDAQNYMELGTPGSNAGSSGWLARHLASADNLPQQIVMPAVSVGSITATSLFGELSSINMESPDSFDIDTGPWSWRNQHKTTLRNLYSRGGTSIHLSGIQALDAIGVIESAVGGGYTPANGAATHYNNAGGFGQHMRMVAQLIKEPDLGLRVAALDIGGWDTHNGQGDGSGGYFSSLFGDLASGLHGFYLDLLGTNWNRVTVVVMSEFGRRLRENNDRGTDHGHGNPMFVLGGSVNGGIHGLWPGLHLDQLFDQADLDVTTDYRRVLSEILVRRLGNRYVESVFPGYAATYIAEGPLGIVSGTDLPVTAGQFIFGDGFESGTVHEWAASG